MGAAHRPAQDGHQPLELHGDLYGDLYGTLVGHLPEGRSEDYPVGLQFEI